MSKVVQAATPITSLIYTSVDKQMCWWRQAEGAKSSRNPAMHQRQICQTSEKPSEVVVCFGRKKDGFAEVTDTPLERAYGINGQVHLSFLRVITGKVKCIY